MNHTKSLGVTIDDQLSWSNYIIEVCKRVSSAIGALKRIKPFVSQSTAIQIYNALIQPHLDYCSSVWDGLSNQLSDKLQKLQNRAARVIAKATYETSSNVLLEMLKWDSLSVRQKAVVMFKSLNKLAPVYLQDLFNIRSTNYNLRNSCGKLTLPKPHISYLMCSLATAGLSCGTPYHKM